MSAVRDIEFSQISADWDSITLGEEDPQALLVMRNGLTMKQANETGDYKVSRIETIGGGWIDETRVKFASRLKKADVEKYLLRKGDILFSHINSDRHLGKTGFAERDYDDLLHGMNLLLIRANPEVFDPEFLNRVFQYYRDIGVFIAICSRAVNQSSINQAKMKALELPLPPLPEQKKIAHILSTVQRAIEAQERIIQTTTELKKALMQKLFTEGLRNESRKQTEIGPVPESWGVVEIGEFFQIKHGFAFDGKFFEASGKFILMTPGHFNEAGGFRDQGEKTKYYTGEIPEGYLLEKNDLVIAMTEQKSGLLGSAAFVPESGRYLHNQRLGLIVGLNTERLSKRFLFNVFNTPHLRLEVSKTSTGSKVKHTSPTKLRAVKVGMPPTLEEQEEIADAMAAIDRKIAIAARKRTQLQGLFRTLLHELMAANIRIHDVTLDGVC